MFVRISKGYNDGLKGQIREAMAGQNRLGLVRQGRASQDWVVLIMVG